MLAAGERCKDLKYNQSENRGKAWEFIYAQATTDICMPFVVLRLRTPTAIFTTVFALIV
jgi:hypothetical protein